MFRYLDKKGVVHADITLNNLIVTKDGVVKLIDFDLARVYDPNNPHKKRIGVGTPPFCPPEQNREDYIHNIDVYSLGIVIRALLEKKEPSEQIRGRVQLHQDFRDIFPKSDIDISKIDQITQEYPIDNLNKLLQGATEEIVKSRLSMEDFLDGLENIFNETSKTS
ncbi:MAG: protein kinase [Patescibacteria group bacterium]|nr:protein kinase [Patescibacteria group bacterium]